jgi:hypothetical protein
MTGNSKHVLTGVVKGTLREKEMPYIGHLLTAKGVKPDQEKIAAITNMEKSILGQVKFQMAFSTNGIFRMEFRKSLRNLAVRLKSHARIHF